MRIVFLQNIWHDYVGVMSISAYLKARGYESRVFIEGGGEDLIKTVKDYAPHLIGFPCLTGSHQWALSMAAKLKREIPAPSIFGGIHPTFFPDIIRYPQVDLVCRGEGEEVIVEVMDRLEKDIPLDDIKGLWVKKNGQIIRNELRPLIEDLDQLPIPDRDLYYRYKILANNPTKHFMAGRGCLFNCSFCYNSPQQKLYHSRGNLRLREIEGVLKEIAYVKRRYPLKTVVFDDDVLTINQEWLFRFLDEYRRQVSLPFIGNVRADLINKEIAVALKEAGCFRVCMGVESGDEEFRYKILNKRIKDRQIIEAARILKEAGIKILTNNMLGLPGETLEGALTTVTLNIKLRTDYPWCSILQPYPGTEIADYALKNGYLKKIDLDRFQPTFFESSLLEQKDIGEVVNLQKFFYLAVKFPWLLPLIKRLVRFNCFSRCYNLIFLVTFAFRYMTANRYSLSDMFYIARDSLHLYIKRKVSGQGRGLRSRPPKAGFQRNPGRGEGEISVSVIIPDYNSTVIDKVINSLVNQSYPGKFETIIVGRDDNRRIKEGAGIKFYETEGPVSPAQARKIGLNKAQGNFIVFLDADCIPHLEWMRELVKRFSEGHIFIWGGMAFPENGYWTLSDNISWFYTSHLSLGEGEYAKTWPPTANMGISKSLVERVGGFDMTLPCGEDIDLAIKLNSLGQNPYFVPTACVYHYHPRAGFKDLIRHASLWGRDSIIMRKRFRKILSTPLVLRSRILLFIFAPFISWWVTFKIFLRVRALRKFLYTFPAVYISKIAWCYAGWRALRYEG